MNEWIANKLRRIADRIDHQGAPKATHWSFTYETGTGAEIHTDGRGCRLWYLNDAQRELAWLESRTTSHLRVSS